MVPKFRAVGESCRILLDRDQKLFDLLIQHRYAAQVLLVTKDVREVGVRFFKSGGNVSTGADQLGDLDKVDGRFDQLLAGFQPFNEPVAALDTTRITGLSLYPLGLFGGPIVKMDLQASKSSTSS